jgi:hypothetical protein
MRARSYALGSVAAAFAAFLAVVAANLAIDPQMVFGTGLFGASLNPNDRYQRFLEYEANADRYDGLLLGSSRVADILTEDLSPRMNGVSFMRYQVTFGTVGDFLPMLQFVLRDKAQKGSHLRAVFLLIDIDALGKALMTNEVMGELLPRAMTGENAFRFWWKNLTAIQFQAWRDTLRKWRKPGSQQASRPAAGFDRLAAITWDLAAPTQARAQAAPATAVEAAAPDPLERVTMRPDYLHQLGLLRQIVTLCRKQEIPLVVVTAPLSRQNAAKYDLNDLARAIDDVSRIVPIWDFTNSDWLSDHPELWKDWSHFQPEVGHMMLDRIFGADMPVGWKDFGQHKPMDATYMPRAGMTG